MNRTLARKMSAAEEGPRTRAGVLPNRCIEERSWVLDVDVDQCRRSSRRWGAHELGWQLTVGPVCSLRENLSVGAPHRYKRPCMAAATDNLEQRPAPSLPQIGLWLSPRTVNGYFAATASATALLGAQRIR